MPFRVGLVALLAGLLAAAPAPATAGTWTPARTVSSARDAIGPIAIEGAPNGALIAWGYRELQPPAHTVFGPAAAALASAPPVGAFSPERPLPSSFASGPMVGLAEGVVAQVILRPAANGTTRPEVAIGSAAGVFGAPQTIPATVLGARVSLSGNAAGEMLLAWIAPGRSGRQVWASVRPANGRFGAPQRISASAGAEQVTGKVSSPAHGARPGALSADMALAFASKHGRMLADVRLHGRAWGRVQDIGPAARGTRNEVAIAIARNSRVLVAWHRQQLSEGGPLGPGVMEVAQRAPGHRSFASAQVLESDRFASEAATPVLLNDHGRDTILAFIGQPGASLDAALPLVRVAYGRGGRFGAPATVSPGGQQASGLTGAEGSNFDLLAWSGGPNPPDSVLAPTAAIMTASSIGPRGLGPVLQASPPERAGLAAVAYAQSTGWLLAWRGEPGYAFPALAGLSVVRVASCPDPCTG